MVAPINQRVSSSSSAKSSSKKNFQGSEKDYVNSPKSSSPKSSRASTVTVARTLTGTSNSTSIPPPPDSCSYDGWVAAGDLQVESAILSHIHTGGQVRKHSDSINQRETSVGTSVSLQNDSDQAFRLQPGNQIGKPVSEVPNSFHKNLRANSTDSPLSRACQNFALSASHPTSCNKVLLLRTHLLAGNAPHHPMQPPNIAREALPKAVLNLLLDPQRPKYIFGDDDNARIEQSFGFLVQGLIPIGSEGSEVDTSARFRLTKESDFFPTRQNQVGMKKLCDYYLFPIKKDKKIAKSNWSHLAKLSEVQEVYSAEDAWYTLMCALRVKEDLQILEATAREKFGF